MFTFYDSHQLEHNNTFRVRAVTRLLATYDDEDQIRRVFNYSQQYNLPFICLGEGSNVLFTKNFMGIVAISKLDSIKVISENDQEVIVQVGSGLNWDKFVAYTVERGWYGAENLSNIPGTVGGAAIQNIGAYGVELKDIAHKVYFYDRPWDFPNIFTVEQCQYGYRTSIFKEQLKGKCIISYVQFKLQKSPQFHLNYGELYHIFQKEQPTLERVREVIIELRSSKLPDPAVTPNAGSFFMNPYLSIEQFELLSELYPSMPHYPVDDTRVKIPAGWLIEQCGWKGKSIGQAAVHDKQALVIINKGGATAQEIIHLADEIIKSVKSKFHITLKPEVIYI